MCYNRSIFLLRMLLLILRILLISTSILCKSYWSVLLLVVLLSTSTDLANTGRLGSRRTETHSKVELKKIEVPLTNIRYLTQSIVDLCSCVLWTLKVLKIEPFSSVYFELLMKVGDKYLMCSVLRREKALFFIDACRGLPSALNLDGC